MILRSMRSATKRQPAPKDAAARIQARYWIETAFPLQDAADIMAGEQSTGTFIRVPGETNELSDSLEEV